MYVEQLKKNDIAELINIIKEQFSKDEKTTEEDISMNLVKHVDGNNYLFVKSNNFMKCWISDFTCATRVFDASALYRTFMGKKFGKEYVDSYRIDLTKKSNEKNENKVRQLESTLNI